MIAGEVPTVHRSGFAWEDDAWRFVAMLGNWYAFASTPERAVADCLAVAAEVVA